MTLRKNVVLVGLLALVTTGCDAATMRSLMATLNEQRDPRAGLVQAQEASGSFRPAPTPAPEQEETPFAPDSSEETGTEVVFNVEDSFAGEGDSRLFEPGELSDWGIARVESLANPAYGDPMAGENVTSGMSPALFNHDAGYAEARLGTFRGPNSPSLGSGYGAAHLRFVLSRPARHVRVEFDGTSPALQYVFEAFGPGMSPAGRVVVPGVSGALLHVESSAPEVTAFILGCQANGGVLVREVRIRF